MSGPMKTLRLRQDLRDFYARDLGVGMANAIAEASLRRLPPELCNRAHEKTVADGNTVMRRPDYETTPEYRAAARLRTTSLDVAGLYWVSRDMARLTMHAASSRASGRLSIEDMPTQHGFLMFEEDMLLDVLDTDGKPSTLAIAAMTWSLGTSRTGAAGAELTYYSRVTQTLDSFGKVHGQQAYMRSAGPLIAAEAGFLPFGTEQETPLWWQQFAATLWHLMDQEIVGVSKERPAKKQEKAMRKRKVLANTVNVVTLRRARVETNRDAEPTGRHLSVRYIRGQSTGGYWQTVHYGPGRSETKKVWIMPHWVGRDDAPIVFRTATIYRWAR